MILNHTYIFLIFGRIFCPLIFCHQYAKSDFLTFLYFLKGNQIWKSIIACFYKTTWITRMVPISGSPLRGQKMFMKPNLYGKMACLMVNNLSKAHHNSFSRPKIFFCKVSVAVVSWTFPCRYILFVEIDYVLFKHISKLYELDYISSDLRRPLKFHLMGGGISEVAGDERSSATDILGIPSSALSRSDEQNEAKPPPILRRAERCRRTFPNMRSF